MRRPDAKWRDSQHAKVGHLFLQRRSLSLQVGVCVIFRLTHSFLMLFVPFFFFFCREEEGKQEVDADYYLISVSVSMKAC